MSSYNGRETAYTQEKGAVMIAVLRKAGPASAAKLNGASKEPGYNAVFVLDPESSSNMSSRPTNKIRFATRSDQTRLLPLI